MRAPKRGVLALAEGAVNYLFYAAPAAPLGLPLVLFGGTAQVLNSMLTHHGPLSKGRALSAGGRAAAFGAARGAALAQFAGEGAEAEDDAEDPPARGVVVVVVSGTR